MKVMFWNTQRLGGGSAEKKTMIEAVVAHAIRNEGVDLSLFCELTSDLNLGDVTLSKQMAVAKRNKRQANAQLGYGCITADSAESDIEMVEIPRYTELFENGISYRGGNDFMAQSKRKVAGVGQVGTTPIFMYHANSSYKSTELVRWVVAGLDESHSKFLLVGDFNCSPGDLKGALNWGSFNVADGGATHNAKNAGGPQTTLDFAVGKGVIPTVKVMNHVDFFKNAGLADMPDHLPILVSMS